MDFSHYTGEPVELAVGLVNTLRPSDGRDSLADPAGLAAFLAPHQELWLGEVAEPSEPDLRAVHKLRRRLREVFEASDTETAAALLNQILADGAATPRVSLHRGVAHFHFEPRGTSIARWLAVVTAMGLAAVVVEHGTARFGVCTAQGCRNVFVDTSRNRSRRHCSTACSVRDNVAALRSRRRGVAPAP